MQRQKISRYTTCCPVLPVPVPDWNADGWHVIGCTPYFMVILYFEKSGAMYLSYIGSSFFSKASAVGTRFHQHIGKDVKATPIVLVIRVKAACCFRKVDIEISISKTQVGVFGNIFYHPGYFVQIIYCLQCFTNSRRIFSKVFVCKCF